MSNTWQTIATVVVLITLCALTAFAMMYKQSGGNYYSPNAVATRTAK